MRLSLDSCPGGGDTESENVGDGAPMSSFCSGAEVVLVAKYSPLGDRAVPKGSLKIGAKSPFPISPDGFCVAVLSVSVDFMCVRYISPSFASNID